ncbi:GDNF family receptor alpha-like [Latimeria chalumnae]|uniref:GDNF family receptor alpha-like n=1 Tax=Latimeria chalumnae TaxID=7897 RepID=UPI00313E1249
MLVHPSSTQYGKLNSEFHSLYGNISTMHVPEYNSSRSCLDITLLCIGDEVCNKQLIPQIKACSEKENQCNFTQCQNAIRSFYDNLPLNVGKMLVFCNCNPSDARCQQAKEVLHSRPCGITEDNLPTCVEVIHSCLDDEICRQRYEVFQSKCWGHLTKPCYNDEDCLRSINRKDATCTGDDECRAAYIGTRGTILQTKCTCNQLMQTERPLCELFYHILYNQTCYSKLKAKKYTLI